MIDTDIPYLETHLNVALSLYTLRFNCSEQNYVLASMQQSIEKRLLVHLHVLARSIDLDEKKPKDDAELFIYVSRRLLSPNKENQKEILLFSRHLFVEFIQPKGLIDAFILFYNQGIKQLLDGLFESNKELRAAIITIWHYRRQQIPIGLLNQSELQLQDNELQSAVLKYNSEQESIGLDLFKNYYRSLVENVESINLAPDVLHASLWGGMLRQDVNIQKALRRAIELESDNTQREKYLRLASLIGSNELLPVFSSVAENKPEYGSYLIALLGTTEAIKVLFSMLQKPQISVLIIPAWQLITGQELKVIPRISLVKDNPVAKSDEIKSDEIPLIADIEAAQKWAKKYVTKWQHDTRYIHGEVSNPENLIELSYLLSGKIGKDVFDLLSLHFKGTVNLKLTYWVSDRFKILDQISTTNSTSHG